VSILSGLRCVEVVQVDEVTWTPGSPLHRSKVLERAYRNCRTSQLDIDRLSPKLGVRRNALKTLDHVQIPDLRSDQCSFAAMQQRRDGMLGTEQRLPQLDVTTELRREVGELVKVL